MATVSTFGRHPQGLLAPAANRLGMRAFRQITA
jgi:hypothetical protein